MALCIVSVTPPIFLEVFNNSVLEDLSVIFMFLIVAVAVGLFIFSSMSMKKFDFLSNKCIDTEYGVDGMVKAKKEQYQPKHTMMIAGGVILCIMSVVPVIAFSSAIGSDFWSLIGTALLFVFVAVGVFMIVQTNITNGGFNILLEEEGYSRERKTRIHVAKSHPVAGITGAYWCIVTAVFFAYSFITWDFGRSWVIFPIAGILTPVIAIIAKAIYKK